MSLTRKSIWASDQLFQKLLEKWSLDKLGSRQGKSSPTSKLGHSCRADIGIEGLRCDFLLRFRFGVALPDRWESFSVFPGFTGRPSWRFSSGFGRPSRCTNVGQNCGKPIGYPSRGWMGQRFLPRKMTVLDMVSCQPQLPTHERHQCTPCFALLSCPQLR